MVNWVPIWQMSTLSPLPTSELCAPKQIEFSDSSEFSKNSFPSISQKEILKQVDNS